MSKYGFDTTEQRSKIMRSIGSEDTKPEITLRKALWNLGLRYRKNYKGIIGKPDIAFIGKKIAVFIDGEFWHGYNWEDKKQKIKSNKDYWVKKIEGNIARDKKYNKDLEEKGWMVIRFWQNEIENDLGGCIQKVQDAYEER